MTTYTTVPPLTDSDLGKVLLANYLKDGDPAGWFKPPFVLDAAFRKATNTGLTAIVAYRANEPYTYTIKGIPLITKTLKYSAIPSILSGLVVTKDGTTGVTVSAGSVRYLNSAKEWAEANIGAQTILLGSPTTGAETWYIAVYDLETTPKVDAFKTTKALLDSPPKAATVDPTSPAIIVARVDLAGAGNVIEIFNNGIHAGLEATKTEDLREMLGVIQHNIEPTIDSTTKTTLSYADLPDRYILGYTNFGKVKQDNRFPYIGAVLDTKPTSVATEFLDSGGNAIIQSSLNIASQELSKYTSASNPAGDPLKREEFVLHPIFAYLDIENTPIIKYAIVRSAVVFRKKPLSIEPLAQQIRKYMLDETLGNTAVPQFITDFCTLCGFLVVDDTMDLRTTITQALIIPAAEGFSSIQDRPDSLAAPTADDEGLIVVKEGNTAVAKGLPTAPEGSVFETDGGIKVISPPQYKWIKIESSPRDVFTYDGGDHPFKVSTEKGVEPFASVQDIKNAFNVNGSAGTWQAIQFTPFGNTYKKSMNEAILQSQIVASVRFETIKRLLPPAFQALDITYFINRVISFNIVITTGRAPQDAFESINGAFDMYNATPFAMYGSTGLSGDLSCRLKEEVNNENQRILDIDLVGATVANGQFTNYGTPKLKFKEQRFDSSYTKFNDFAYSQALPGDPKDLAKNILNSPDKYKIDDTKNNVFTKLLRHAVLEDGNGLFGDPAQWAMTNTPTLVTALFSKTFDIIYNGDHPASASKPLGFSEIMVSLEILYS